MHQFSKPALFIGWSLAVGGIILEWHYHGLAHPLVFIAAVAVGLIATGAARQIKVLDDELRQEFCKPAA